MISIKNDKDRIFKYIYVLIVVLITAILALRVTDWTGKRYQLLSLLFFAFSVTIPFWGDRVKEVVNKYLFVPIMLVFPAICFFITEKAMDTDFTFSVKFKYLLGNYALYLLIFLLIYALTLSLGVSVCITGLLSVMFGVGNYLVILYRQIPILAGDIAIVGTAMNVIDSYVFVIGIRQFMALIFLLSCISFCIFCFRKNDEVKFKVRAVIAALYLVVFSGSFYVLFFTDFLQNNRVSINTFMPIKSYNKYGGILTLARSVRIMVIDKPDGYSIDELKDRCSAYESDSISDDGYVRPNVIVVMDEAFADLQELGELNTDIPVMPFYDSLEENTIKGQLYVSVFGGQTANSEFEFLTGDSKAFLPAGTTPFQLYIKSFMPSVTSNLKADSYGRVLAMHPFNPSGYNRQNVYNYLQFDRYISINDFAEDVPTIGGRVRDEADFDRIIEEYENARKESDEPFYIFNVTMQNHSPYDHVFENLDYVVGIEDEKYDTQEINSYINLVHESDRALEKLVGYFSNVDEPTVIVFFGDHEPGLSNGFYDTILGKSKKTLTDEESFSLYHTSYFIWANYDIDEESYSNADISVNYLQSLTMEVAGMKQSGYNKFLVDLMKDVPIININGYLDADGKYYSVDDDTSKYYEQIKTYQWLSYNHLFDKKNRLDDFFEYKVD
ncbi:LTA synthase family protein [Butyrivibrio sp. AD3002]|uniref:LTA synthase family protein n=1 Tax=Butyrivibrio sp. AD3002 TaxID=1280670 RepID=UPI0003B6A2EE|nr:LTA synthase family protein [Butyrivibrio sp. AD3002]